MIKFIKSLFKKPYINTTKAEITTKTGKVIIDGVESDIIIKQYLIPVGGLSEGEAKKQLSELISNYKEDVTFDETSGAVNIDGNTALPFTKEFWIPAK